MCITVCIQLFSLCRHGINKRFTRRAQKFKQATGLAIEPTHDLLFEALNLKFEEQQEDIRQLARDVQGWVRHVKIGFDHLQQVACSMESLYESWGGVRVKSLNNIDEFNKMASYLACTLSRELVIYFLSLSFIIFSLLKKKNPFVIRITMYVDSYIVELTISSKYSRTRLK